jgi:DNA repair exonuclease SbcCD ATPase subunit
MKIVSLQAENVKRLVAVEIRPDGNLVEITGKNGQGKTSVLDSIWWALAGSSNIQGAPIRKGETEARIQLDLGTLKVIRTFHRKPAGDGATTSIAVENAEGARYPSPQKMLDALLGELTFDPLAFARMKPREQFNALRKFVPGVDFDGIANLNRGDFERRTDYNRFARQERAAAAALIVPPETPENLIDEAALVDDLARAGEHNSDIELRKERRSQVSEKITRLRTNVASAGEAMTSFSAARAAARDATLARIREQIRQLEQQAEDAAKACAVDIEAEIANAKKVTEAATREADDLQAKLAAADELPSPIDVSALRNRIEQARATNAAVARLQQRGKHIRQAEGAENEAQKLSDQIDARNAAKQAAIAAAAMPVAGIGFGDDQVLLNGVPFEQGSDAEQLQASVKIAAAMNPKLRVIRIRDGSLLDDVAMINLATFAQQQDLQIWVERVDSSGAVGFVIEDGHVRKAATKATEESAA